MLHNYAKMVLEFSLVNTLCVFLTVTQIWEFIDVPKKMAFQTAKKHYFPVLKTVVNKGIRDAGSTADIRMLWPWSALVCLGLL